jgi:transcriptional regulator with XRE-family HTH domain
LSATKTATHHTKSTSTKNQLLDSLRDEEYRLAFVDESINVGLASQIRALQRARGWSQKELGQRAGMAQESISLLESPFYGRHTLRTLKRLAAAFQVALIVKFAPFSELAEWADNLTPKTLAPMAFEDEISTLANADSDDSEIVGTDTDYTSTEATLFAGGPIHIVDTAIIAASRYRQATTSYLPTYEDMRATMTRPDDIFPTWDKEQAHRAEYATAGVGEAP